MRILPNLNFLRFFLAMAVLVFHVPQMSKNMGLAAFNSFPIFNKGTEAVNVFFALSGFLIIRKLWIEKDKGMISIKKFYMRRILRIIPLYLLIVVFGFLYYRVFLELVGIPFENNYSFIEAILLFLFFLPNIAAVDLRPGGILEILWSIGIEEQFYLLIAPVFGVLKKHKIMLFLSVFTVLYFILFHNLGILSKYKFLYFYFSFGGLIGILSEKRLIKLNKTGKFILAILFIIYFFSNWFYILPTPYYNAISVFLFGFFILSISEEPIFMINNKLINYFGKISYGIYVYHPLAMHLMIFLFLKLSAKFSIPNYIIIISVNFFVITLTILIAHFSYKYYELYFLKLKNKFR
ncbi:acyltransferase family protein [Aquimarina rubra]|uniref:Acyltransferase family protein n=1 Tax=Aquimarina rubra TaxID=1920033 RepID=A0ABW5LIZ0_9FLAO